MGNCISVKDSSTTWGGEEWGTMSPVPLEATGSEFYSNSTMKAKKTEEQGDSMEKKKETSLHSTTTGTEVKIKITKKQLEEILSKVDGQQGQSLKHVLTQLMSLSTDVNGAPQRSWRPALQSIPESETEVY